MTVLCEAFRELVVERIQILGIAVVKKVPHDLDLMAAARLDKWPYRAEVMSASLIDERPANRFAGGKQSRFTQPPIVFVGVKVVMRCGNLIDPLPVSIGRRCAFEAREKKATKHDEFP